MIARIRAPIFAYGYSERRAGREDIRRTLPKTCRGLAAWNLERVNVKFRSLNHKKKGRGAFSRRLSPRSMDIAHWAKAIGLEGELGAKPERRWRLHQQRRAPEGIRYRRN